MPNYENNFNNFKIHSQYSICEGAIKIDDLAEYCKINKIKSIGLADSFNLCGALEFSEKISKVGTQPIIGTQINIIEQNVIGKISLYATSEIGYKNLLFFLVLNSWGFQCPNGSKNLIYIYLRILKVHYSLVN